MRRLEIKNIGPIKSVAFDIKKVNVFMGHQSSGKSTIAKILSFCTWMEKDISFRQSYDEYSSDFFIKRLETFHKMKGYFLDESYIKYDGDAISILYSNKELQVTWKATRFDYKRVKISYIPSERSTIILPEMEKLELPNNYLRSYLYDWFDTRKNYTRDKKFSILDLGIDYYYSEENRESHISNSNYDILLSQGSSGLQSIIPLLTMVDNLIVNIYEQEKDSSYETDRIKSAVEDMLWEQNVIKPLYGEEKTISTEILADLKNRFDEEVVRQKISKHFEIEDNLFKTHKTNLIIEEPEQNLFPSTQKQLCYKLVAYLSNSTRDHSLTLTTHSPYILYSINNCILNSLVSEQIPDTLKKDRLSCNASKIAVNDVNIFEINEGTLKNIQQESGLIGQNYFDAKMKDIMDDYYFMLNFMPNN